MHINVINLDISKDRLKHINDECLKNNIKYNRFPAINGSTYILNDIESDYLSNLDYDKDEDKGTLGCFLSHIKLLEKFKETDDEYMIVCEDDIIFNLDFIHITEKLIDIIKNYGFINLYSDFPEPSNKDKEIYKIDNDYTLYDNTETWVGQGCVCYMISKEYCIDILNKYYNNECNAAIDYFFIWSMEKQSYIYPPLVKLGNFNSQREYIDNMDYSNINSSNIDNSNIDSNIILNIKSMLDINKIKCYIINLERCPNKKENMINRLKYIYPLIPYEIINAVDGRNINEEYMKYNNYSILEEWKDPSNNRKLTLGEIGCSLSHYNIYKTILKNKDEYAIILEDDAILVDNFYDKINTIINNLKNIEDWDMLYLGRKKIDDKEEIEVYENIYESSYSYWCIGYIVNKRFCEKVTSDKGFLRNIIPIDEYLPLIGNISPYTKYKDNYDANIKILTLKDNLVYPEPDAFQHSDTEIMTFLPSKNKGLFKILTVATDNNEPLQRFEKSCNIHNLNYKVLGLDKEWTGGNMSQGPGGGMKLNLLKEELKDYKDEDIILFSDSYDVIFLSYEEEIYDKYLGFNTNMLFSAEKACWPDVNMKLHFNSDSPYRYLNSGGFMGNVKSIKMLINCEFADTYDDQLLMQKNYVKYKDILNIKLDTRCNIFQTSSNNTNDIDILYGENRIRNNMFNTIPCHYHGNGGMLEKIRHNNICNYLLMEWNNIYDYISPKLELSLTKTIYIFVNVIGNNTLFYNNLKALDYPKSNIIIHINTNYSNKYINDLNIYNKFIITNHDEPSARKESMKKCLEYNCDYYLNYDNYCIINDTSLISKLISYDKNIVSPLITIRGGLFSNHWGLVDKNGWYEKSFNYMNIINHEHKGCWNSVYINNIYLIKSDILENIKEYYTINYNPNKGHDMALCENLRKNNYYMYTCNEEVYGYLLSNEDIHDYVLTDDEITVKDYIKNKNVWKNKYLHKDFGKNIKEPTADVLQFPIVNEQFCKEIIQITESYGKWSGATNEDSRIGHENIPSNDIHLTEINMDKMWEEFIHDNIAPLVSNHWGSYKTKGINIAFVIKYDSEKYYKLEPHHDASSYTLNICLNDDFKGGGVNFIKKGKVEHIKYHGLIHPGRVTHYHEGLPVEEGIKYIMVSFID